MKKLIKKTKALALLAPVYAASAIPAFAAPAADIILKPGTDNFKNLVNLSFENIIAGAISLVMLVVALVFFFMLIWGGLKWVMSEGDEKNVAAAKAQITNALVGLAIVFAAWAIMKLIETVFDVTILSGLKIPTFQ